MEPIEQLPGMTFYLNKASSTDREVVLELRAPTAPIAVQDKVLEQLSAGIRIYTVSDLSTAAVEVLQQDGKDAAAAHQQELNALRTQVLAAQAEAAELQKENARLAREVVRLKVSRF